MKATFLVRAPGAAGVARKARPTLSRLGEALGVGHCTLSVLLTDDAGIRDYNRRFRGRDEATDVLSFAAEAGERSTPGHYLGDLIVSMERARAQARQLGHTVAQEVEVLLLHGVLHLLGHDHDTDGGLMRALERQLAQAVLGGSRGLIERAAGDSE